MSTIKLDREGGDELLIALHAFRRQLSREQVRELIRWTVARYSDSSDRAIAAKVGADHKTVAKVRGGDRETPHVKRTGRGGKRYAASKPAIFAHNIAGKREVAKALGHVLAILER